MNGFNRASFWKTDRDGRGILVFADGTAAFLGIWPLEGREGDLRKGDLYAVATSDDVSRFVYPKDAVEERYCQECGLQVMTDTLFWRISDDARVDRELSHGEGGVSADYLEGFCCCGPDYDEQAYQEQQEEDRDPDNDQGRNPDAEWIANAYGSDED